MGLNSHLKPLRFGHNSPDYREEVMKHLATAVETRDQFFIIIVLGATTWEVPNPIMKMSVATAEFRASSLLAWF